MVELDGPGLPSQCLSKKKIQLKTSLADLQLVSQLKNQPFFFGLRSPNSPLNVTNKEGIEIPVFPRLLENQNELSTQTYSSQTIKQVHPKTEWIS